MIHYHISRHDHGEKFEFTPKVPGTAGPKECQTTKRVCFSPSVWQCLIGVCGTSHFLSICDEMLYVAERDGTQPVVYETRKTLTPPPKIVSDFKTTGEVWSLESIVCRRRGFIDLKYLITHQKVRLVQTHNVSISKDFIEGWRAAAFGNKIDWKTNPPGAK